MNALHAQINEVVSAPPDLDGLSLPGWIYRDADFLEAEKERNKVTARHEHRAT